MQRVNFIQHSNIRAYIFKGLLLDSIFSKFCWVPYICLSRKTINPNVIIVIEYFVYIITLVSLQSENTTHHRTGIRLMSNQTVNQSYLTNDYFWKFEILMCNWGNTHLVWRNCRDFGLYNSRSSIYWEVCYND